MAAFALLAFLIVAISSLVVGVSTATVIVVALAASVFVAAFISPRVARWLGLAGMMIAIFFAMRAAGMTVRECDSSGPADGGFLPGLSEASHYLGNSGCRAIATEDRHARGRIIVGALSTGILGVAGALSMFMAGRRREKPGDGSSVSR
jgi:hypothetical protein